MALSRMELSTISPEATRELGCLLGGLLEPGDWVALTGELGSGKTTLAAGIAAGLEVREPVTSPSYLLCCEYEGRAPLAHLDAYFTARLEGLLAEGLADRLDPGRVVVLEWADRVSPWLPEDLLTVHLEGLGEERSLRLAASGARSRALLAAFAARIPAREALGRWPGPPSSPPQEA